MIPRIKGLFKSNTAGMLILIVLIMIFLYSSYTSQQQLDQSRHLTKVVQCQTRVNNQFNAVLKYNNDITEKTNALNDKDRANLTDMVSKIGDGIQTNKTSEIRTAILDYNKKTKKINGQRKVLIKSRAQYPKLPKETCQ